MTTTNVRPILLGIGESGVPEAAVAWAAAAAVAEGRPLHLVHVLAPQLGLPRLPEAKLNSTVVRAAGQTLVANAAARARALVAGQVEVTTSLPTGYTTDVLTELGAEADRIVLSRHDLSRLQRVFTGSVVCGVAGRSVVPVISVSESWKGSGPNTDRVTVGVDGDLADSRLLHRAFRAAAGLGASLHVVHASQEAGRRVEGRLDDWHEKYPDVPVDLEVAHERPADALVRASESSGLLVVGRLGAGHHIPHLGPLTRAVIRESHCPVEIVPSGGHPHEASPPGPGDRSAAAEQVELHL